MVVLALTSGACSPARWLPSAGHRVMECHRSHTFLHTVLPRAPVVLRLAGSVLPLRQATALHGFQYAAARVCARCVRRAMHARVCLSTWDDPNTIRLYRHWSETIPV